MVVRMDDAEIRTLVRRIARRSSKGGYTVERATLVAEGSAVSDIEAWIVRAGGVAESAAPAKGAGLFADRVSEREASRAVAPLRYTLPAGVFDEPASSD
jgi:hypothetical protein